jgi:hypothetical protein
MLANEKRACLLLAIFTVTVSTTVAAPPPTLPTPAPAPPGLTIDILDRLPLDGEIYLATRATLLGLARAHADERPATDVSASVLRLHPAGESFTSQDQLTSDAVKDAEPSVITRQLAGVNYKIVAAIKSPTLTNFNLVAHSRASSGASWDLQLPMPAGAPWNGSGYIDSGDPFLARAASNGAYGWVNRVYCVGTLNTGTAFAAPSGIGVWYSDTGGATAWSGPEKVAENLITGAYLDKPAIAASQLYASGDVYVAYTRFNDAGGHQEIHVARSTDGGNTFPQDVCVEKDASGNCVARNVTSSQILVDDANGYLYVLWIDFGYNQIKRAVSLDHGLTWQSAMYPITVVADATTGGYFIAPAQPVHGTTAPTNIIARFNTVTRTINVAWHSWNAAHTDTDVYLATKSGSMSNWLVTRPSGINTGNDQFFPALDYDTSGNVLISYYTRVEDGNNRYYRPKSVLVRSTDGTSVRSEEAPLNDFSQPPGYLTDANGATEAAPGWIGDYHDVFYSAEYGTFFSAWIGWPSAFSQHYEAFNYGIWY